MKKVLVTLLAVMALVAFTASANAVTWTYHDFGTNYFDFNNNYSPVFYPNGISNLQSPGHGGQGGEAFDIEGFNFAFDNTYMYLSITASFGSGIFSPTFNRTYNEGQIFFGFDGSNYDYALDPFTSQLYGVATWTGIPVVPGGYGSNAIISAAVGPYQATSGFILGNIDETYSFYLGLESNPLVPGDGNTYIKEYRVALADLGVDILTKSSVHFQQTMECGNDLGTGDFGIVPEPASMILLGMGLLGMGAYLRRKN